MRSGLSTIQQTLTPAAAAVLIQSISDAARRRHGQTTPLHVAAALLSSPSGLLRRACSVSHPNSSHPLHCRALELCFSIALDRLPCNSNPNSSQDPLPDSSSERGVSEPPLSNALMAALKRAQAQQRRGGAEATAPPLLAIKVELEQLVLSILDDPSVSRVMREASFSSTAVKSAIEKSTSVNIYLNPRLPQTLPEKEEDEVRKVFDVMLRSKKRNPVLVGDADVRAVMKEVVRRIESGVAPAVLGAAKVVSLEKSLVERSEIPARITELGSSIEGWIGNNSVVIDLGDLKWLVEGPAQAALPVVSEVGRAAVAEMGRIIRRFGGGGRLWFVGIATCATYLRCQVYYPAMEGDWDLQAVPITARSPLPGVFPRPGGNGNGILSNLAMATMPTPLRWPVNGADDSVKMTMCQLCTGSYERELAKLAAEESTKSPSKPEAQQPLPQWLKLAKLGNGDTDNSATDQLQPKEKELLWKQRTEELQKKWRDACGRLHPSFHLGFIGSAKPLIPSVSMPPSMSAPCPPFKHNLKLSESITSLQMSNCQEKTAVSLSMEQPKSPPGSGVKTDLVLGRPKVSDSSWENSHKDRLTDDTGCKQDAFLDLQRAKTAGISDIESFKRLFKGLTEKVSWQPNAASAIATVVMQCKSGGGKRQGIRTKSDTWLLFIGPDRVGKRKMVTALSELVFGTGPITVSFGSISRSDVSDGESNTNFRGKTSLDRVVEAIRQNPFSVILLEDIDQANVLVQGSIKRAMDRGRLPDSRGREVSLNSVIFILTADWWPQELNGSIDSLYQCEEKILNSADCGWQLELSMEDKLNKHRADWLCNNDRPTKLRKESSDGLSLSLDLNLAVESEEESRQGSVSSSDLTVEQEHEKQVTTKCSSLSPACELMELVDDAIVFQPVDFRPLKKEVLDCILAKFKPTIGNQCMIKVDDDVLDRMVCGIWLTGATLEEWAEKLSLPSIQQLKGNLKDDDGWAAARLSAVKVKDDNARRSAGSRDLLPTMVTIAIN
ncbi:protein SMAX1-like [Typha angustifolia]|uniref:protein SMAX1-like n=1 Tax=Typha angustifolia TaxID=59011 RepID=UPI003C2F8D80